MKTLFLTQSKQASFQFNLLSITKKKTEMKFNTKSKIANNVNKLNQEANQKSLVLMSTIINNKLYSKNNNGYYSEKNPVLPIGELSKSLNYKEIRDLKDYYNELQKNTLIIHT